MSGWLITLCLGMHLGARPAWSQPVPSDRDKEIIKNLELYSNFNLFASDSQEMLLETEPGAEEGETARRDPRKEAPMGASKRIILLALALALFLSSSTPAYAQDPEALAKWNALSDTEKNRIRQNYDRWKGLSPEAQEKVRHSFERFRALTPERRAEVKRRFEKFQTLSPDRQKKLRERFEKFSRLTPAQRRDRFEKLRERRLFQFQKRQRFQRK